MTEAVRGGVPLRDESLFDAVTETYNETIAVIKEFAGQ